MTEKRRAGRPTLEFDIDDHENVKLWVAGGLTQAEMALLLDIDMKTLRKHFAAELRTGAAVTKAKVLEASFAAAMSGNVSAQNKLLSRFDALEEARRPKAAPKPGKKEERQQKAEKAAGTGRFAVPHAPKLVVAN